MPLMELACRTEKLGLLLPGGSCRGAFQIGVLQAFKERGIAAEVVAGVSSGSWNAVAWALDEVHRLEELWLDALSASFYSKSLRQWATNLSPFNYKWIHKTRSKFHLDWDLVKNAAVEVVIGVATFPLMRLKLFSNREHPNVDFFSVVLASNTLMPFHTLPVRVGTGFYVDGGFADNAPVHALYEKGCDRVIAVVSRPTDRLHHKPMRPWGFSYPNDRLALVCPEEPLPLNFNDFDPGRLREAIRIGYETGLKAAI